MVSAFREVPLKVTIPSGGALSWESQEVQFPPTGEPGISYEQERVGKDRIDCFLYRNDDGKLDGILYHYADRIAYTYPGSDIVMGHEEAGNVNVFIRPDAQRRGIATQLLRAATEKLGPINFAQQDYTPEGAALIRNFLKEAQ